VITALTQSWLNLYMPSIDLLCRVVQIRTEFHAQSHRRLNI
jgi:hypothetical protein